METNKGSQEFEPSHYDYDFDFDFDLQFTGMDYLIIVFYALFVMPFVLLVDLVLPFFQQHNDRKKDHHQEMEGLEPFSSELCVGPCCLWPETPHS